MKHKLTTITYLLLFLMFSSCQESILQSEKEIIIAGEILNFETHKDVRNFRIYHQNFFDIQIVENVEINDDGSFQTSIPCHYSMDFIIRYEKASAYLICVPNDSIFITIDGDILNNPKNKYPNGSYFAKVTVGSSVDGTEYVNEFLKRTVKTASFSERQEALKNYSPTEYFEYRNELEQKKATVLDSILQKTNARLFKIWARDYLKYEKLDELLIYTWKHPKYNKISADSFYIPNEYFSQIFDKDINETEIFSHRHYRFLQSYYIYLCRQAKKERVDIVDYMKRNATGFSKDIVISKYIYGLVKESDTLNDININLIDNKYIKDLLSQKIETEQKKKIELLNGKTNSEFIDSLFSMYKGKVVYVDFWGTWCSPCLKEMPYSKVLQEQFKDKPVEFLFLCTRSNNESWQKTIKEKKLTGTHILLNDKQYADMQDLLEITGIPHYAFINKQGNLINNALRPSDENTSKKLNQLLNE